MVSLESVGMPTIVIGLLVCIVLLGIIAIYNAIKVNGMDRRYQIMMQGALGEPIEEMMKNRIRDIEDLKIRTADLEQERDRLESLLRTCLQKAGVIRFNAFTETGSDLSFAVALLDDYDNGVVLTSIFGRNDSRVYAKPLIKGESTYSLTNEEKDAIEKARKANKF